MFPVVKVTALILFTFLSFFAQAQTTFTGAVDQDWMNASNWSNGLPAIGNDATILSGFSAEISGMVAMDYNVNLEGVLDITGTLATFGVQTAKKKEEEKKEEKKEEKVT